MQAAALDRGPLALVQSLTTLSLVLALPLGALITDQRITRRVVLGAALVVLGLVLFVSTGNPAKGSTTPTAAEWLGACFGAVALMVLAVAFGRRHNGALRAALIGTAAGFAFGLQGAVTKAFVSQIGGGVSGLLTSWTTYALIASALIGLSLQQSALKTGSLAPALASANAVTLFTGVVLGVRLFDETLKAAGATRVAAFVGLALALVGVIILASADKASEPRTRHIRRNSSQYPRSEI